MNVIWLRSWQRRVHSDTLQHFVGELFLFKKDFCHLNDHPNKHDSPDQPDKANPDR